MSRKTLQLRRDAQDRWPALDQFLGGYCHQDFEHEYGSVEKAIDAAVLGHNREARQQVAREWWDWNRATAADYDVREKVAALGVDVWFETSHDARQFMNMVYDKLIVAIRKDQPGWRPDAQPAN